MYQFVIIILTPLLTLLVNYVTYKFIRAKMEQKIHQNNIAYSGIFQEKIKVYREFLEKIYDLKLLIDIYRVAENQENTKNVALLLFEFMRFYNINRPFLSNSIHEDARKFQKIFTLLYQMQYDNSVVNETKIDPNTVLKEFDSETLERLEKKVITKMKEELDTL